MQASEVEASRRRKQHGFTMQRLRRWLLACTLVLVAVVAGFIGYARQRARRSLRQLPHLLGADIRSVTDGYTFSQTVKGRTLFTIHAAKAIQRKSGKTTLHDVAVTLYGEPGSNRTDSIRGAEFEYDQPNGVIRAVGETELELAAPMTGSAPTPNAKRMTIHASGLVLLEKLGVAATEEQVRFQYGTMTGQSQGADYDADTGLLRLHHDVHIQSKENGHLEKVDAQDAVLDRQKRTAQLHAAVLEDAGNRLEAQTQQLDLRPEGGPGANTLQQARAEGNVTLESAHGAHLHGARLLANFTETNRPMDAVLTGGVDLADGETTGHAKQAHATFNTEGRPQHVDLLGNASLHMAAGQPGATRDLTADRISGDLRSDAAQRSTPHNLTATGNAQLRLADAPSATGPGTNRIRNEPLTHAPSGGEATLVSAAVLRACGADGADGKWVLQRMEGDGATRLEQRSADGRERTSSGDHLLATFGPAAAHATNALTSAETIQTLAQQGHVTITDNQSMPAPTIPGQTAGPEHPAEFAADGSRMFQGKDSAGRATANRVEYTAATGLAVLTGNPVVNDAGTQIASDRVTLSQTTGDAEAQGNVKGSYAGTRNASAARPPAGSRDAAGIDFLADHAVLLKRTQTATLTGGRQPARLWSGSAQLEAPIVDILRADGSIHAHAAAAASGMGNSAVRAVFPAGSGSAMQGSRAGDVPVRIFSNDAVYTQASLSAPAQAHFNGGVRMIATEGTIFAKEATAFFQPASGARARATPASAEGLSFGSGALERVVAQGSVSIQQPGRKASGDRLVFTAADQQYRLTGTETAPPVVRDNVQGTVIGGVLLFHPGDGSIEVSGSPGGAVHSEALVPERKSPGRSESMPPRKAHGRLPQ